MSDKNEQLLNPTSDLQDHTLQAALKSVLLGSFFSFLGLLVSQLGGIALRVLLARLLTPEEFGRVSLGLVTLIVVSLIALLGFDNGVSRFIAYYAGKGQTRNIKAVVLTALKVTVPAGLLVTAVLYVFAPQIARGAYGDNNMSPLLRIFVIAVPFYMVARILNAGLRGLKKIGPMVLSDRIIWRVLPLILFPLFFVCFGMRTRAAGYALLVTVLGMSLFSLIMLIHNLPRSHQTGASDQIAAKLSRFSLPLALVNVTNGLKTRAPVFILGFFMGASEIALFSISITLAAALNIFLATVVTIFGPVAAELHSQQKTADLARLFSVTVKWMFVLAFPVASFLVFYSRDVVTLIFGDQYTLAATALAVLAACFFFKTAVGPTGAILQALGKSGPIMHVNILTIACNIILNLLLIPHYGVTGAAIATGTAIVLQQLAMLYLAKTQTRLELFKWKIVLYLAYCLALIAVAKFFAMPDMRNIYVLVAAGFLFYLACLVGIWVTGQLEEEDYKLLGRIKYKIKLRLAAV